MLWMLELFVEGIAGEVRTRQGVEAKFHGEKQMIVSRPFPLF
jgi:hypothetical protein